MDNTFIRPYVRMKVYTKVRNNNNSPEASCDNYMERWLKILELKIQKCQQCMERIDRRS